MDLTDTIQPTSDQLDAVDLFGGPRTFTIERVEKNNGEQPVNIHLAEFPRVWRPGKSMRRVLVACWGPDASRYVGRRLTLYCDPDVKFGGEAVGGTRISHLSHIDKPRTIPLLVTRGKSAVFRVQPLREAAPPPATPPPAADQSPEEKLRAEWKMATPERRKAIEAEVRALTAPAASEPPIGRPIDDHQLPGDDYDPTTEPGFGQGGGDQ